MFPPKKNKIYLFQLPYKDIKPYYVPAKKYNLCKLQLPFKNIKSYYVPAKKLTTLESFHVYM